MDANEFALWLPTMREVYAEEIAGYGGLSTDEAKRKAIADLERLFPDHRPSTEQFVFVVEADGEPVGDLWIA